MVDDENAIWGRLLFHQGIVERYGKTTPAKVRIGDSLIGEGEPCFVIAEAGVNHNGDINLAKKLIDVAREAGADAVKFQTFKAEEVVTQSAEKARYQKQTTGAGESQFEMIKKLELAEADFEELYRYAQKKGLLFLSSPFDKGSVDFLDKLGVAALKIPSGEITNFPLLRHIANKKKPIILSTGMSTLEEIEEALAVIQKEGLTEIVLLYCVSSYPAKTEEMNLRAMETLKHAFKLPVGLSDHTLGVTVPVAAIALGACVIEKHFTLDKSLPGPDHRASLEPDELKAMIKAIRDVAGALGDGVKKPTVDEEGNKKVARRSIVARVDIPRGATITEGMLAIKRAGGGLAPKDLEKLYGARAKDGFKKDEAISWAGIDRDAG